MKKTFVLLVIAASVGLCSCQKQQTEEERKAEIDREVQDRLAAERQAQQQQDLAKREADLNAREKALADQQGSQTVASVDAQPADTRTTRTSTAERDGGSAPSYDMFYTRLEPYGSWLETGDYGYVWQPREGQSSTWRPYLNGHWVYTDAGWTWVSDEPFGWATYHYGRWTRLRNIGWVWVPGEEWAPAWVSWRKGDDYVGWAPLPPEARFDRRSGIHNWADNYYDIGPAQYCFVPTRQLGAPRVETTVVPVEQNLTIINRTTNVTNITYSNTVIINQGPNYDELRNRTEQPIPRLRLERQVAVSSQPAAPVVRGEVIQMSAPVVERARRAERPRQVRQTIAQTTVDRGWADIGDSEAGRQARAKMKAEATPPPDAPAKTITKTDVAPATTATASAPSIATPHRTGSPAGLTTAPSPSATATATAAATPMRSTPRPQTTVTPSPPVSPTPSPSRRALTSPEATPTSTVPNASATPATATATPQPAASPAVDRPRVGDRLKSQARRLNPNRIEPAPSASATGTSPGPSVSAGSVPGTSPEAGSQPMYQRPGDLRRRPSVSRPRQPDAATTESAPGVSPSPSASPEGQDVTAGQKREGQNGRGFRRHEHFSPSPTPSP